MTPVTDEQVERAAALYVENIIDDDWAKMPEAARRSFREQLRAILTAALTPTETENV